MAPSSRSFAERVRRNHALEHATLHVLARDMPGLSLVGRSDWHGFLIYGQVDTDALRQAVLEGWERLRSGQSQLCIHPRCGTNLAVTCVLAGAAILAGGLVSRLTGRRRWPLTVLGIAGALTLAAPLGPEVQRRMTTDADMEGVSIGEVRCERRGRLPVHRVEILHES